MPLTALGEVVFVQTDRRHVLRGRAAGIVLELLENLADIERLHTGTVSFHLSQGSVSIEVSRRGPPRKPGRLLVAQEE